MGTPLSSRLRLAVLGAHALLLAGLPLAAGRTGALLALPLLLPLRGLWLGRAYTYAWCSMLVVFYLGVLLADRRPAALALAVVAATEFLGLMLYVRARSVEQRRAATTAPADPSAIAARTPGSGGAAP